MDDIFASDEIYNQHALDHPFCRHGIFRCVISVPNVYLWMCEWNMGRLCLDNYGQTHIKKSFQLESWYRYFRWCYVTIRVCSLLKGKSGDGKVRIGWQIKLKCKFADTLYTVNMHFPPKYFHKCGHNECGHGLQAHMTRLYTVYKPIWHAYTRSTSPYDTLIHGLQVHITRLYTVYKPI